MGVRVEEPVGERPDYNKTYLLNRLIVGIIGVALPFLLMIGDKLLFDHGVRNSLSAYYHGGMRDWFVGSLWAIGVGLFTYMGTKIGSADNWISTFAGIFAIFVTLFPTTTEEPGQIPTAIQQLVGEQGVSWVHFGSAALFIGLLGVMCLRFGIGDGRREDRTPVQRKAWRIVHFVAAGVIWLSITVLGIITIAGGLPYAILIGEIIAVIAFGLSWFFKGSELFSFAVHRDRYAKAERGQQYPNPYAIV